MAAPCSQCGLDPIGVQKPLINKTLLDRIDSLRRSNENTFGAERSELETFASSGKAYADSLGKRLAAMKQSMEKLDDEKKCWDSWVKATYSDIHPIRGVPREILSEIFIALAEDTPAPTLKDLRAANFTSSLSMKNPAWIMSHVSSSWRSAALATASLWTNVFLNFDSDVLPDKTSTVWLLDLYLSRSMNHKLSVYLYTSEHFLENHRAFPVFLLSSPRWKSIDFAIPFDMYDQFSSIPGSFSALERVMFETTDPDEVLPTAGGMTFSMFSKAGAAPLLRSITTTDAMAMSRFKLAWSQITHYHALGGGDLRASNHTNLAILNCTVNVQSVTLTIGGEEAPSTIAPFQRKHLSSLSIRGPGQAIRDFCGKLTLPALERLQYHSEDPLDEVFGTIPGTSLIVTHGLKVKDVSLTVASAGEEEVEALERMLKETTSITRLELVMGQDCEFDLSDVSAALTVTKDKALAPFLETLVIKAGSNVSLTPYFIDMIKSRRSGVEGVAVLKRVEVDFVEDKDEEVREDFFALMSEGLEGFMLEEASEEWEQALEEGFDRIL